MSWISARKALVAGASSVVLTLALGACGAEDELAEQVAEEAVEAAGDGQEVDIEDDGVTVTDENGDEASIGTTLPESFPTEDVPLLEGTVVSATAVDKSYTVLLEVEGTPEEVQQEALALLSGAGYTDGTEMNAEGYYASTVSKEGFEVGVTSMAGGASTQVQYIVTVS